MSFDRKAWRAANKERIAALQREADARRRERMRDELNAQNKAWREANKEYVATKRKERYDRDPAASVAAVRAWRQAHLEHCARKEAARRLAIKRATPPWLTAAQKAQMVWFQEWADEFTEKTGVKHVVDHIWPIRGKNGRGLHVPWNLQVLTFSANSAKGAKEPCFG